MVIEVLFHDCYLAEIGQLMRLFRNALNELPRKMFGYRTLKEFFEEQLAMLHFTLDFFYYVFDLLLQFTAIEILASEWLGYYPIL